MRAKWNRILYLLGIKKLDGDFLLGNPYTDEQIEMMKTGKLPPKSLIWNSWYHRQVLAKDYPMVEKAMTEAFDSLHGTPSAYRGQ